MTGDAFRALVARLGEAWNAGDAAGAAACFAADVDYADPVRYRFATRAALLPFFEPPPGGHRVTWHRILYDEAAGTGVVEYTYEGHHRYHGAAIVTPDENGRIAAWREWQHLDDERGWDSFLAGPPTAEAATGRRLAFDQLAAEADVDPAVAAQVLEVRVLEPGPDGAFDARDGAIVRTVAALLEAGFKADDLRWLTVERTMRFDVIGRLFADPGPPSPRTVAEVERAIDPSGAPVARLYDALGLPEPAPGDHLPADEERLVDDYLRDWLAVDPSGAAAQRVARAIRDAIRQVTESWLDTWDAAARPSMATQGGPTPVGVAAGPEAGAENPTVRMAEVGRRLLPMVLDRSLQSALNARIVAAVERTLAEAGRTPARPKRPAAIAFVDLTGFTSHTVAAGDEAAAIAAERLRAIAEDRIAPHDGRLVKVLGDGVLLLFPDAASAVRATLSIVTDCTDGGSLPAYGAIAAGRVVRRQGDVYGATVNLAARLSGVAGPGEVVVEEGVIVALPRGTAVFEPIGRLELRGFPEPVAAWRARPPGD